jgi:hypothetical protein
MTRVSVVAIIGVLAVVQAVDAVPETKNSRQFFRGRNSEGKRVNFGADRRVGPSSE